jgi:hypothetical protein
MHSTRIHSYQKAVSLAFVLSLALAGCATLGTTAGSSPESEAQTFGKEKEILDESVLKKGSGGTSMVLPESEEGGPSSYGTTLRVESRITSLFHVAYVPTASIERFQERVPQAFHELASQPASRSALRTLAYNSLVGGERDEALGYLKISDEKNRGLDEESLNLRGIIHLLNGEMDEAERDFQSASAHNSSNPIPNLNLGLLKQHRGNALQAMLYFKRAIAADPASVVGYLHAANTAYENKQFQTSVALLRKGLSVAPSHNLVTYNLGIVQHYGLRKHSDAKESFKSVIRSETASERLRDLARGMLANVQREEG